MPLTLAQNNLLDALVLTVVGMGVVFGALVLLMLMIGGLHRAVGERPAVPKPAEPRASKPKPTASAATASTDDELIVVLTAAAAALLGQPASAVRVLRFRSSSDEWASAGRGSLTRSHRPSRSLGTAPSPPTRP